MIIDKGLKENDNKKPSFLEEKGRGRKLGDTEALHSPRQTTIILSAPIKGSADIRCLN